MFSILSFLGFVYRLFYIQVKRITILFQLSFILDSKDETTCCTTKTVIILSGFLYSSLNRLRKLLTKMYIWNVYTTVVYAKPKWFSNLKENCIPMEQLEP